MLQASSRRRNKTAKSRVTGSSDDETSRSTEPSRKCSTDSARVPTTNSTKSSRAVVTSSDSESSSSSSDDAAEAGRHRTAAKTTSAAASKSRLITSSSDSDDSSDDESVTLVKNRITPDKSRKTTALTSTPLARHSIYTSSDNDDDSDSDSVSGTPVKKAKPSLSMSASASSGSKPQPKKPVQSSTKKPTPATPSSTSKTVSKPFVPRETSTDSDATAALKGSKSAVKDTKKQHKVGDSESHMDNVVSSSGQASKKEVKKPAKSITDKPVPHRHVSSLFGDALAKAASHTKLISKTSPAVKDQKVVRKDARSTDAHKSASSVSVSSERTKQKSSHADVSSLKSKHSISESRHAPKSSSDSVEKKSGSERPLKSGHDAGHENSGRKVLKSEALKTKKVKQDERNGERIIAAEAESDESPLIRPGNIFEKMEKQDSSADKSDETRIFGHDTPAHLHNMASEIAVFMPESDDDDEREPVMDAGKLSIERLKEDSAKEETIEEAVKAIIEFTKEPTTPPLSSSKATDSELLEDTSGETADDDVGLSDDVGELNAAIGNLIEKELEPAGEDDLSGPTISTDKMLESETSVTSPSHYRPSTHGALAEPKNELSPFVGTNSGGSFKEEHGGSIKMEVESMTRHIQTPAHDEQNVTSFMSRLEKATADVVDFAAISAAAAAAASRKVPEKTSSDVTACSKPEVSSRLFAGAITSPPVKTEEEQPVVVKKEEPSEQAEMTVKPEPPEFPLSTRILSSSKQPEVHGTSSVEKGPAPASTLVPAAAPAAAPAVAPVPAPANGEPANGDDSSTTTDLYEFKDDDDDESCSRQKEFVLHKRSRKRHADSESNDAADAGDVKKLRSSHVKCDQHEAAAVAVTTEQCSTTTTSVSDSQPVSSQSSWRTNMDLVIEAVARGEFERGDDFNYYSSQNTTGSTGRGRRGRGASRDDAAHKAVPASTPGCVSVSSNVPSMPADVFNAVLQRSMAAVITGTSSAAAGGRCSPKLLLSSMASPQQIQQLHRSLSVSGECIYLLI